MSCPQGLCPERNKHIFEQIEQEEDEVDSGMLDSILEIPKIITAYQIETDNIKSKQNLII